MNMKRVKHFIVVLAVLFGFATHAARADCAAPGSEVENAGCQARMFSGADEQLDVHFAQLVQQLDPKGQETLSKLEQNWLHQRDAACVNLHGADFTCAVNMTAQQDALVLSWLDGNAPLPTGMQMQRPGFFQYRRDFPPPMFFPNPPPPRAAVQPSAPCADAHNCVVLGTAMPWEWQMNGLNGNFQFGVQDGSGPTTLNLTKLGVKPGQLVSIKYLSGEVKVGGGWPQGDANGVPGGGSGTPGSTGRFSPSRYMAPYPINLGSLVGVFCDAGGKIVGQGFALNDGTVLEAIPAGAVQLQLGVNDDRYGDNTGSFIVSVNLVNK